MPLHAGETVAFQVRGVDGLSHAVITDAACTVNLFAPGRDPVGNPAVRASPDVTVATMYNAADRYYEASVSTAGWASGTWTAQGVISGGAGDYYAFGFESFPLCP